MSGEVRQTGSITGPSGENADKDNPAGELDGEQKKHVRVYQLLVGIALLCAVILYVPTLGGGFLCDDYWYLEQARTITFTEHPGEALRKGNFYYFRPVPSLAWSSMYHLFSLHAPLYRAVSLLLHMLVVLAVAGLARRVLKSRAGGGAAALLFALCPLHPEAVAWVSANAGLMAALFATLALSGYLDWRDDKARSLAPVLLLALAAMLSKESAYVLPLLALATELLPGASRTRRRRLQGVAALFGVAAIVLALKFISCGGQLRPPTGATPLSWWPGNMAMALLRLLFPAARSGAAPYANYLFVAAAALGLVSFFFKKGSWKLPLFGILFAGIALLPPTSVARLGPHLQFSRVMYLPSIGFAMFLAYLFHTGRETRTLLQGPRVWTAMSAICLAAACAAWFAGSAMNIKPWVEAGKASKAVEQAFLDQAGDFRAGQSVLVKNLPLTYKGVPFHSNSYTLSLAFSMARFPERWKERGYKDKNQLPVYAVLDEAPAIEARMTPVKRLRELKRSDDGAFDYHLVWETGAAAGN